MILVASHQLLLSGSSFLLSQHLFPDFASLASHPSPVVFYGGFYYCDYYATQICMIFHDFFRFQIMKLRSFSPQHLFLPFGRKELKEFSQR